MNMMPACGVTGHTHGGIMCCINKADWNTQVEQRHSAVFMTLCHPSGTFV